MTGTLWTDGGSRGNPGLAAAGIVLEHGGIRWERGWFLGTYLTNNEAEYQALILGLNFAVVHGVKELVCYSDSKLIVNQVNGDWKCRDEDLRPLMLEARKRIKLFSFLDLQHIARKLNTRADELANEAMDKVSPR